MFNKIIATGVVAAGITGAVLLAGPANAAQPSIKQTHPVAACYAASPYVAQAAYCVQPVYPYPGHYGWGRWHHHHGWHGWHHRY